MTAPCALAQPDDANNVPTATTVGVSAPTTPAPSTSQTGCPTVTATRELCETCPVPACLGVQTITQSCGCPTPIATEYLDFPCSASCSGVWCTTSYVTVTASDCPSDADGPSPTHMPEIDTTTLPANAAFRVSKPPASPSSSSTTSPVSTNAAGRIRAPIWLW